MQKFFLKLRSLFIRTGFFILVTIILFIPAELFFMIKSLASPSGFWQNFVIYGPGLYFLGAIQFALFLVWLSFVFGFFVFGHIWF